MISRALRVAIVFSVVALAATRTGAQERYAVIVAGASGGAPYAEQYAKWTDDLSRILTERMKIPADHLVALEDTTDLRAQSTAVNVRRAIATVRARMTARDLLLVVLIGHGTFDGVDAKFNLVGPDLESAEWASLLDGLPGRVVIANTASAGFPFLQKLAGPRRVVISATDNAAQRYDTVFPEFFIHAFEDLSADIDKNGRVSIWEAFAAATASVRRYYQRQGQLPTERALLDDNGDGVGHEPGGTNDDGPVASTIYLDVADPDAPPTDEVLVRLLQQRAALEGEAAELRIRRRFITDAEYQEEFERIMVALAKVQRELRERRGSL